MFDIFQTKGSPEKAKSPTAAAGAGAASTPKPKAKEKAKKSKKKFARHKIRSETPEKDLYEMIEDPAETQVATSGRKTSQAMGPGHPTAESAGGHGNEAIEEGDEGAGSSSALDGKGDHDDDLAMGEEAAGSGSPRLLNLDLNHNQDDPLERRALISLEKQLDLESPDSEFDLFVSTCSHGKFLQGCVIVHFKTARKFCTTLNPISGNER